MAFVTKLECVVINFSDIMYNASTQSAIPGTAKICAATIPSVTEPEPHQLTHDRYLRSNSYDPEWVLQNQMGPNALWLLESLLEVMNIEPGMKVLDLGCGRAMTSIFLAREFGAKVWANDLWISPGENQARITEAGVADLVTPIHAEAHTLPYATDFFDVIVSLDAYHYFGTADLYLGYLLGFLRPEGRIGIVSPAGLTEIGADVPEHLQPHWDWEFCSFHSPDWWRTHWTKTQQVTVETADSVADGWKDWQRFNKLSMPYMSGWLADAAVDTEHMLEADQGRYLGFSRVAATKL